MIRAQNKLLLGGKKVAGQEKVFIIFVWLGANLCLSCIRFMSGLCSLATKRSVVATTFTYVAVEEEFIPNDPFIEPCSVEPRNSELR